MGYIFVSYARRDLRKVKRVIEELRAYGFEFWQDTNNIRNGKDWPEEITNAIDDCSRFLLFMSAASMASDNVKREVQIAYEKKKKIIILRLDESKLTNKLSYQLIGIQRTDYLTPNWETKIVSALGRGKKIISPLKSTVRKPVKPSLSRAKLEDDLPAAISKRNNGGKFFQKPKPAPRQSIATTKSLSKKPVKPQVVIAELEGAFSANREYYIDECAVAISKLDNLCTIIGSHWVNPALAYTELVPRVYLLEKIEHIKSLLQDFQATCHPGSSTKRHLIHDELKRLNQELSSKAS